MLWQCDHCREIKWLTSFKGGACQPRYQPEKPVAPPHQRAFTATDKGMRWNCTYCGAEAKTAELLDMVACNPLEETRIHTGPASWLCDTGAGHVCDEPAPDETILDEAKRLVTGDRQEAYSHPKHDFATTAKFWTVYVERRMESGHEWFQPEDVAAMMILLKLSREAHKHKRDNLTDACGYAYCAQLIQEAKD